jgi:hypothetical protein
MSETIFFSYSRADSEFVLNLATTLRSSGANIWLDQLDIKPGSRWDRSIEEALNTSQTVLVVLSKSAVESTNVMDEVSYALEEQKKVVPVLMESCTIPFRLRRLQLADFSKDEVKGIQTLIEALNLDRSVADKLSGVVADQELKPPSKPSKYTPYEVKLKEKPKESTNTNISAKTKPEIQNDSGSTKVQSSNSRAVWPYVLIGFLIVVIAGGWFFKDEIFNNREEDQWNLAKVENTIEGYKKYQELFPNGEHFFEAKEEIAKIDEGAWKIADSIDTVKSYETYKIKIPEGKYINDATQTINALKEDSINWAYAKEINNVHAYDEYLSRTNTKLKYIEEALNAKNSLTDAFILALEDDDSDFEEDNTVKFNDDGEILTDDNKEPTEEDIKEPTEAELEKTAWEKVKESNNFDAYMDFIRSDDNRGVFHDEAVNALKRTGSSGWLFVGRTNDNETFSSDAVVSVIYRKNSSVTNQSNVIPKVGDLVTLNSDSPRNVYATSQVSKGGSPIATWKLDKKAYVQDIRKDGTAYFIKVIYNNN